MMKKFDTSIGINSKISKLPKVFRGVGLLMRHLIRNKDRYFYKQDGMATIHNFSFLNEKRFQYSLASAIKASGFDYKINLRLHQAIWCADHAVRRDPSAVFVELGTGRGYVMSAVLAALEFNNPLKLPSKVLLFDTFVPFKTDFKSKQDPLSDVCIYYADSYEQTSAQFAKYDQVQLIKGKLPETLDQINNSLISFLHIDLNAADIEFECLRKLWASIIPGGVILLDDYAYSGYEYTHTKLNNLASILKVSILVTASGQGIILK